MPYVADTFIAQIDTDSGSPETIALAGDIIRQGGLVAFPTETVYGLGANAFDEAAINRIFEAKQRPANDPIIVHIAIPENIFAVARDVPDVAATLAQIFWPGPLTLILKKNDAIPGNVTANRDTVAVRIPNHPVALSLLRTAGVPIGAPSANRFSRPSPTRAEHVLNDLAGSVDVVLDSGNTPIGVESTIIDLTSPRPRLLRPGGTSLEALREHLPDIDYQPQYIADNQSAPAPGSLLKHYAPQAAVTLYEGERRATIARMHEVASEQIAKGQKVGLLLSDADIGHFEDLHVEIATLGDSESTSAARLYQALRELDTTGADVILARAPRSTGLGLAIRDRLIRAAEGRLVTVE
ncbi:MAG: threonylcarbamoyl-AMP synthase [Anaerolineaceae bacterium]|nr:threonylcarbamoyl-AMP synthase [Anaerolineaceae bacterium]